MPAFVRIADAEGDVPVEAAFVSGVADLVVEALGWANANAADRITMSPAVNGCKRCLMLLDVIFNR